MPNTCTDCRHFEIYEQGSPFEAGRCKHEDVRREMQKSGRRGFHTITFAIGICRSKPDGQLTKFQQKEQTDA